MQAFWAVFRTSFRAYLRDRSSLFWGAFFPILLMALIGGVFGQQDSLSFTLSVPKEQPSTFDQGLMQALKSVPSFEVVAEPRDVGLKKLQQGDRTLVLDLPESEPTAEAPAVIQATYNAGNIQTAQGALAIVREVLHQFNQRLTKAPQLFRLDEQSVQGESFSFFSFLLPGIMAMTIMQSGLMGVAAVITEYRERLVLKRVLATPVSPFAFIGGLIARYTFSTLLQALVIFLVGTLVFHAKVVGSVALLFGLAVYGAVVFLAIGFLISTLSRTSESANLIGSVFNFLMMFLSGVFWPTEFLPQAIRPIVAAFPLSPLVSAMRGVATEAQSVFAYGGGLLYMLGWMLVAFLISAWRFRWE